MDKIQNIIYDILYGDNERLRFDMTGMAEYIEDYSDLMDDIIDKVNRGDVDIIEDSIIVNSDNMVFWELRIKRKENKK